MNKHAELSFLGILGCVIIPALHIVTDVILDLSICASILFPMFNRFVMIKTNTRHVKVCYWQVNNKNSTPRTVSVASLAAAVFLIFFFSVQSNVDNFIPVFLLTLRKWSFWYKFKVNCREM